MFSSYIYEIPQLEDPHFGRVGGHTQKRGVLAINAHAHTHYGAHAHTQTYT